MLSLREYREPQQRLCDRLVWSRLVAPGVVEQKDGLLQCTVGFRGPDLASSTKEELVGVSARLNNALRRLGAGWSVFVEAQRTRSSDYPVSPWPEEVSALVDLERQRMFAAEGEHFESRYYLTFVYAPPKQTKARFLDWLFVGGQREQGAPSEYLAHFQDRVEALVALMRGVFPQVERLDDDQTLTYLHSTVSTHRHEVRTPEVPVYLDAQLVDQDLEVGTELKLGPRFVRTLTVRSFPGTTVPGILDELNRLQFEYRWVSRYIAYGKQEALSELKRYQRRWYRQRQGLGSVLSEMVGGEGSALQNSDAVAKAQDADLALQELANDYVSFGLYTATVTVWGKTRAQADERLKEVEATIQSRGFVTITETFNALEAWLSSHPGNVYANIRRPLINSLNLTHMIPMSAVWSGPCENSHLKGPPHLVAKTTGGTPFRLATNVGDVGHTLILGPTGAGKSTLLSLLMLQWFRYSGAQVFCFDKGRSSRAACLGVGGQFYDLKLGQDAELSFQPFRGVEDTTERAWAVDWVVELLVQGGVAVDAARKKRIWEALGPGGVAGMPREQRTMLALKTTIQDQEVRTALDAYCKGGPCGTLFDGDSERLELDRFVTFEMEELMHTPTVVPAVLSYLFHRLEAAFDGRPTLLVLDEAWMFLDHPQFSAKIREWLKVLRKKRVYVVFATQSVADALRSAIAPVILESCLTRILLPNQRAMEPDTAGFYKQLGLNKEQVRILANAQPKREYYYQSEQGNRLFDLGLGPVALAFCGASDPDAQMRMDELIRSYPRQQFAQRWLEREGLGWAALQLSKQTQGDLSEFDVAATVADDDPLDRIFCG